MLLDGNGTHSRTSTAMWNAEGFVEIQVRHITAVVSRTTNAYLSIHIRPIEIHLSTATRVNHVTDFTNVLIKDAKGGGVSDH